MNAEIARKSYRAGGGDGDLCVTVWPHCRPANSRTAGPTHSPAEMGTHVCQWRQSCPGRSHCRGRSGESADKIMRVYTRQCLHTNLSVVVSQYHGDVTAAVHLYGGHRHLLAQVIFLNAHNFFRNIQLRTIFVWILHIYFKNARMWTTRPCYDCVRTSWRGWCPPTAASVQSPDLRRVAAQRSAERGGRIEREMVERAVLVDMLHTLS